MNKTTINRSLLLGFIFIFPLIYQPLHVLFHHHSDTHYHCTNEQGFPGLHITAGTGNVAQVIENEVFKCPVCGYEFTSFSISFLNNYTFFSETLKAFNESYLQEEIIIWPGTNKLLRAPPASGHYV